MVKNLPAMQETWVGKIPWSGCPLLEYSCLENSMERSLAGYSPWGCKESDTIVSKAFTALANSKRIRPEFCK